MKLLKAEAGVNDGKAGLLSAAGLFAKGGIFDKKSESFNIHELDPYLLFDAQSSMLGTLEAETLDLDPATPSTLDVITATRAGTATFTEPDGTIATAQPNTVRVDYTQGDELTPAKYQNVIQTDYSASPNGGFNMNLTDIDGPEGASGGVRVSETAVNGQHYLSINEIPVVSGQSYTVSFYIKEGAYSSVRVYTQSSKINSDVNFNFSTGTATFGGSDLIANSGIVSNVGGGWYRVSYSAIASNGGLMSLYVTVKDLSSYAGDVNNFTDYYGFQVEEGTTASSFVENTTGSPKFITGATFGPRVPMILVEPSATNLLPYSEDFNVTYTKLLTTIVGSTEETPDGDTSSKNIKLVADAVSGGKFIYKNIGGSGLGTFSVFAKAAEYDNLRLIDISGYRYYSNFDLTSGTASGGGGSAFESATIEAYPNGWFRCSVTFDGVFGAPSISGYPDTVSPTNAPASFTGDGVSGIYAWGAQVETGSLTSYIPTSGSTAQRAADDLEITGSDFTDFYNQSEGTLYVEAASRKVNVFPRVFKINGVLGSEYFEVALNSTTVRCRYDNATNQVDLYSGNVSDNTFNKIAVSYRVNDFLLSVDGGASLPDTNASLFSATSMRIGNSGSSTRLNGHIKRLIYWPTHSDNL